ncbi:MAG TPA: hypothetical protein VEZ17_16810 [Chitinophagaceae bacterium]|jgi:hypothetical protein|nr:hypothetical protein [Chitinophagaceae bacterium]
MRTYLLLFIAFFGFSDALQGQSFEKGTNVIALGITFGSANTDDSYDAQGAGFGAQYEKGIWEAGPGVISLGGYLGSKTHHNSWLGQRWNYTILGFRGAYHYNRFTTEKLKKLDPYGGIMVAYSILGYRGNRTTTRGRYKSSLDNSVFVGGRYYFTNNFAGFAELGLGISNLTLGGALKF